MKQLKLGRTTSESEAQQRIEELSKTLQSLQQELQAANGIAVRYTALEPQLATLGAEKEALEEKVVDLQSLIAQLAQEVHDSKESLAEAQNAQSLTMTMETKQKAESEAKISELHRKLHAAEEYAKKTELGMSQLKLSCQKSLDDDHETHRKQTEALQESLAEARHEAGDMAREKEELRQSSEKRLQHEQATWQTSVNDSKSRMVAERDARQEAEALVASLRNECDALRAEIASLQAGQRNGSAPGQISSTSEGSALSVVHDDHNDDRTTPTEQTRQTMPARPRKRADRNTNTIIETRPVLAPEILRLTSRAGENSQIHPGSPELEVKDSQVQVVVPKVTSKEAMLMPAPPAKLVQKSSDSDEMLDTVTQHNAPARAHPLAPETQFEDTPTTSAAFKSSVSSSSAHRLTSLPSQSYGPSSYFAQRQTERSDSLPQRKPQQQSQPPSPGFQIYEDPHSSYSKDGLQGLRDNEFVFRKAIPKPNSASKRVARSTSDNTATSQQSYRPRAKYQTPELTEPMAGFAARPQPQDHLQYVSQPLGSSGSTPPFMQQPSSKKTQQYHGSSGGKAKRRSSQRSTTPLPDPRLTARAAGQKRAAERNDQQLQQPMQKRRMIQPTAALTATAGHVFNGGKTSRASQSVNELPRISDVLNRKPSNDDQSRMRTFGGQPSRTAGRSKKLTKREFSDLLSTSLDID